MTDKMTEKAGDSINAITRAAKVLDIISESPEPLGVSALAKMLNLPKVTTFRILNTLVLTGLLHKDDSDLYYLTPKFIIYGDKVRSSLDLQTIVRPILEKMAETVDESTNLGVSYRDYILTLVHVYAGSYSLIPKLTPLADLHCSSMGKIILCHKDDEYIKTYFQRKLETPTMNTIVSLEQFLQQKKEFEQSHIMFDDEESEYGLACFSSPVYDMNGQFIAAISISGPKTRILSKQDAIRTELIRASSEISDYLRFAQYTVEDFRQTFV